MLYACLQCNSLKRDLWPILDPCVDTYGKHLKVNDDGTVTALSQHGNILLDIFRLNEARRIDFRSRLLAVSSRLQADPGATDEFKRWFGFPDNLPDLRKMKPPKNLRPAGMKSCWYMLRQQGKLPDSY